MSNRRQLTRRKLLKDAIGLTTIMAAGRVSAQERPLEGPASSVALSLSEIGQVSARRWRFGFAMNHRTDDFINSVIEGGQETAKRYGINLLVSDANFDAAKQVADIQALIQQRVNAIFTIAVDADAISSAILQANQANIPVIIVGGPPTRGQVAAVLNSTSFQGCFDSTNVLIREIGGQGKIGVLSIPLALKTIKDRERGTEEAVRRTNGRVSIVASQASFNAGDLLTAAQNMIQANPDLKGIFANWSVAVTAAISAVQTSGREILVCGYDADVDAMRALKTGRPATSSGKPILRAVAGQQGRLQGKVGIDGLCKVLLGQINRVPQEILVPTVMVNAQNVERVWDLLYPGRKAPWQ
jgi:ribose transport system substrate-binding protein